MDEGTQVKVAYPAANPVEVRFVTWIAATSDPKLAVEIVRGQVDAGLVVSADGAIPSELVRRKGLLPGQACKLLAAGAAR